MASRDLSYYGMVPDQIEKDLTTEIPQWILSSYGPGKDVPAQIFGGFPREQSPEELRLFHHQAVKAGKEEVALRDIQNLYQEAQAQIRTVLSDVDGAVKYVVGESNKHPNRLDVCKMGGGATGVFAVGNTSNSAQQTNMANAGGFGRTSALGQQPNSFGQPGPAQPGGSGFGQPSALGTRSNPFAAQNPGAGFGQTSTLGSRPSPFSQAANSGPSPFAQAASNAGPSPFAQAANNANPSPFAQLANNAGPSPFAQATNNANPSPFAQLANNAGPSPFAQATNNANPSLFAQTAGNAGPSPFAQAVSNANPSPFAQTASNAGPNPFARAASNANPSPFAQTASNAGSSPFAQAGVQSQNGKANPFAQQANGTIPKPFGAPQPPNGANVFVQTQQQEGQQPNPFAAKQPQQQQNPSPFATMGNGQQQQQPNPFAQQQEPQQNQEQQTQGVFSKAQARPGPGGSSPTDSKGPYAPNATRLHPPLESYCQRGPDGAMQQWKGKPIVYKGNKPGWQEFNGKWVRIFHPDGAPEYYKDTELPDEAYGPEQLAQWQRFMQTGKFDEMMPELPPKREFCLWDI